METVDDILRDFVFNEVNNDYDIVSALQFVYAGMPVVPTATLLLADTIATERTEADHTGRRSSRRRFDHAKTRDKIYEHYLGPNPLHGSQFKQHFRISLSTFEYIYQTIMNSGDPFYVSTYVGPRVSNEVRVLLPLRTLAYGVPPVSFTDYFECSKTFACACCDQFDAVMIKLFKGEFLRIPTANDLRNIVKFHEEIYGVPGMFGSFDCTHTDWRSCPVSWQSSYVNSKHGCPSLILEALGDHHLWCWHFAYGFAGSMNDINVLHESPLMESFINGNFSDLE